MTPGYRARGGARREDAIHARLAHFMVAFRVDEESHAGIQVAGRFADGADLWEFMLAVLCFLWET